MITKVLQMLVAISIAGILLNCSGSDSDKETAGGGFISLQIDNARAPEGFSALTVSDLPSPRLVVSKFRATVSGEGIDPPIISETDATATEMEVLNIPPGPNRSILIEAVNSDDEVIRRRQIDGLTISPGVVTPIKTSLNTVPLILNLRNGNIVGAKHLKIIGFGEPGSTLSVTTQSKDGNPISLSESAGGSPVVSPSLSTGIFELIPVQSLIGRQTIVVTDNGSGEASSVEVLIIQGSPPGHRLSAAGGLQPAVSIGPGIGGSKAAQFPLILYYLGGQK